MLYDLIFYNITKFFYNMDNTKNPIPKMYSYISRSILMLMY